MDYLLLNQILSTTFIYEHVLITLNLRIINQKAQRSYKIKVMEGQFVDLLGGITELSRPGFSKSLVLV